MTVDQGPVGRPTLHNAPDLPPDVTLAAIALSEEQHLLDVVLATEHRHRSLRHALAAAKSAHEQHVQILTDAVPASVRPKAMASARASASASASKSSKKSSKGSAKKAKPAQPHAVHVPHQEDAALAAVARHEDQLAVSTKRNAFAAESGTFARLLASMAGSAAQHAAAIRLAPPPQPAHKHKHQRKAGR
jgi:hypothetical protein